MIDSLQDSISEKLKELDPACDYDKFRMVCIKLLNQQSLFAPADADKKEKEYYFIAERTFSLLIEVFDLFDCTLYRNPAWHLIYLLPSGASHALSEDVDWLDQGFVFKRPSKQEISLILTLRYLYQQGISKGEVFNNQVRTSLGELNHTFHNFFGSQLPDTQQAKLQLFKRIKRLRLIGYKELSNADDILSINVMILLYDLSTLNNVAEQEVKLNELPEVTDEA